MYFIAFFLLFVKLTSSFGVKTVSTPNCFKFKAATELNLCMSNQIDRTSNFKLNYIKLALKKFNWILYNIKLIWKKRKGIKVMEKCCYDL